MGSNRWLTPSSEGLTAITEVKTPDRWNGSGSLPRTHERARAKFKKSKERWRNAEQQYNYSSYRIFLKSFVEKVVLPSLRQRHCLGALCLQLALVTDAFAG